MSVVLLVARLLLAGVFAVAGAAKFADLAGSRKSMADFGVPEGLAHFLGLLFPLVELVCAVALVPVRSAWWGATGVLALLLLFIVGISINLVRGHRPDCHCFGQLHSSPIGWDTVLRNVVLAGVASFIVWQGSHNAGASVVNWSSGLTRAESVAAGLALAIAVLAAFQLWALMHILRQNGRLLLRIEALETRAGGPVETPPPGLPVNGAAPAFSLKDLYGKTVTSDMLREQGKPLLLFFSEPGCNACDAALPELSQWQHEYADRLLVVPISRGEVEVNRTKVEKYGLKNMLLQADREVSGAYLADASPSAVLVRNGQIWSPLAVGADAIRGLVVRAVLPPSVNKGERAPSLKLPDLDGQTLDMANLRGRRTLILFWNPSCGFCQQMLEDVKAWERNPPKDAPDLLVVSAGSLEDNRKQGFRARVLLDPYFAASQVFNSGGTPSAILIDEEGRVASDVGVGAPGVLAMAGAAAVGSP
jgi:peroxiredoxin